eukprot:tig00020684_g12873.t1
MKPLHEGEQSSVALAEALIRSAGDAQQQQGLRRFPFILKHVDLGVSTLASKPGDARRFALQSFENEFQFYGASSVLRTHLRASGLRIPQLYASSADQGRSWSYALELFPDWKQRLQLDTADLRRALSALASLHAAFYKLTEAERAELRSAVWPKACWWTMEKRPPEQAARLREDWAKVVSDFEMSSPASKDLAPRLHARLPQLAASVDRLFSSGFTTLLHGDFKTGNILFGPGGEVACIDFQWAGIGPPIADVSYLLLSSASLSALEGGGEGALLAHYAAELGRALPPEARALAPAADALAGQHELFVLDYLRATAKYMAATGGPAGCLRNAAAADAANLLTQERSAAHVAFLASRSLAALPRLEALSAS